VTNVAWLLGPVRLRVVLPILAATAVATAATALPAHAAFPAHAATRAHAAARAIDAARANEWWLTTLNAPAAWRAAPAQGKGVTVAVLSTGVYGRHPDLTGSVTTGPDLSQTGRKPGDQYWGAEGTAVASLIAGHGHGNGRLAGVTGIAQGARILSIQVTLEYNDPLNTDATITRRLPAAIAAGIRFAVSHGATVIALPLDPGTLGPTTSGDPAAAGGSQAERAAVSYAVAHNVLLVAPAGDNGAGTRTANYPAAYPGVVAVGATARNGQLSPFTNVGSYVALTSPGSGETPLTPGADATLTDPAAGLLAAAPDGGYQSLASTDMASALTAGVAALIRGRYPWLTVAEVTQALESGAAVPQAGRSGTGKSGNGKAARAKPGWGHGELGAATALTAAGAIATAHPAPKPTPTPQASQAAKPTSASTAKPAASAKPDPGAGVRAILLGLVIVAGVLIAALIGALTIARVRRRSRSTGYGKSSRVARSSHAARHARAQVPPPPPTGSFTQARGSVEVFRSIAPAPRGPRAIEAPPARRPLAIEAPANPSRPHRPRRVTGERVTGERPPWAPARKPNETPVPGQLDPQAANAQLAPWEQSPPDFDALPPAPETPPRPVSTTGPMYIWNPTEPPPV
jgi:subtilisin family serine protease